MHAPDSATGSEARIDLHGSRRRLLGLLLLACGFTALCLALLVSEPEGEPIVAPGSFVQFVLIVGVGFFGLTIPLFAREVLRRGPVVSVSRHGLFDRRLSTGWIPWSAITDLDAVAVGRHRFLRIAVRQEHDAALSWTRRARVGAGRAAPAWARVSTGSTARATGSPARAWRAASTPCARRSSRFGARMGETGARRRTTGAGSAPRGIRGGAHSVVGCETRTA